MNAWKYFVTATLLIATPGVLSGCSSAAPSIVTSGANPTGTGATTSQMTGPQGGTITLEGTTLSVPPGALDSTQMVTITSTTNAPPSGVTSLSPVYEFGPSGLQFKVPVTITMAFNLGAGEPVIVWSNSDGTGFAPIATTESGDMVEGQVTHFSEGFVADSATLSALPTSSDDAGTTPAATDASATSTPDAGGIAPADDGGGSPLPIVDAALPSDAATTTTDSGAGIPPTDAGASACAYCALGLCGSSCPAGTIACGTGDPVQCVSVLSDPNNCGACGTVCPAGQGCSGGQCLDSCYGAADASVSSGGPALPDGGVNCSYGVGLTACGSACVQLQSDNGNCGACGQACAAGQTCQSGACTPLCSNGESCASNGFCEAQCPTGQAVCATAATNATPICIDLQTNANDCGACGTACASGQICVAGTCTQPCGGGSLTSGCGGPSEADGGVNCSYCQGFTACGHSCVDTVNDPTNCGGCGVMCSAGQVCTQGSCGPLCPNQGVCANGACVSQCPTGTKECGAFVSGETSLCTDVSSDSQNCGACGAVCGSNEACSDGVCVATCYGAEADASVTATDAGASSGGPSGGSSGGTSGSFSSGSSGSSFTSDAGVSSGSGSGGSSSGASSGSSFTGDAGG